MADIEMIRSLYQSRFYRVWSKMKQRCLSPNCREFKYYGGRGITLAKNWESFSGFVDDMHASYVTSGEILSLERIDNNLGYCRSNCRWATMKEQSNNRRSNRYLTHNGQTKTVSEWADVTGIRSQTIRQRIDYYGWAVDRALTEVPNLG